MLTKIFQHSIRCFPGYYAIPQSVIRLQFGC